MKKFTKGGRRFVLLLCFALFLGQAACDLCLPAVMAETVHVGVQQGGLEDGLPEVFSARGMTLLGCFLTEEEKQEFQGLYHSIEPESSEGQRLSESYPFLREETACVLREGLTEEEFSSGGGLYEKSARSLFLYWREGAGSVEESSQDGAQSQGQEPSQTSGEFGENLRLPSGDASPPPDGVLGSIPSDALFTLPEGASSWPEGESGNVMPFEGEVFGDQGETHQDDSQPEKAGRGEISLEGLYGLLPQLASASKESLLETAGRAQTEGSPEVERAAPVLKKMFYEEAGLDTEGMRSGYLWGAALQMLGVFLLGTACSVLGGFCALKAAENVSGKTRGFAAAGLRGLCYGPAVAVAGMLVPIWVCPGFFWIPLAVGLLGFCLAGLALAPVKLQVPRKLANGLIDRVGGILTVAGPFAQLGLCFLTPAVLLVMGLLAVLIILAGGRAIETAPVRAGSLIASIQYAVEMILAFLMTAAGIAGARRWKDK